jgi:hypothetical protein
VNPFNRYFVERVKQMATPLGIAASQQRHKSILVAQPGESPDQLWARAATFTSRVCRDNRDAYALIKKPGGRRCNPDGLTVSVDCDKIIDRATLKMYDLVGAGGAPEARPVFDDTGAIGNHDDFVEPPSYPGDTNPIPPAAPGQPANPPVPIVLPGREEMMHAGERLHNFYRAQDGLQRNEGLWIDGHPDWEGLGAWLFDTYLPARVAGKSADEAWAAVERGIRGSDEWKRKHPA